MGFLRRRDDETLNEILLREAGLGDEQAPAPAPEPRPVEPVPALPSPPEQKLADAMVVARAPQLDGGSAAFVALPGGDLIVEDERGDADLSPLAAAVEAELAPPYRARATRQRGDVWGIVATRLDVLSFSCDAGEELELVQLGGRRTLTVDGAPSSLRIPELERAGEELPGEDYDVCAARIDGDFWEIRASAL